ncbi:MAG: aspartate aminotransferase family protein [Bacteroidetes bacterium]|nr:aspartate aminotransferase family protein [Bacteroidota bacterium]
MSDKSRKLKSDFLKYIGQTSVNAPLLDMVKGSGSFIYDRSGKRYLDFTSGIAVNNIGHGNNKVITAIKKQTGKYLHANVYGEFIVEPQVILARHITSLLPSQLNCVYFVNSGSEAIEGAIKLARRATGRKEIISFRNSYHGSTFGALSISGNDMLKTGMGPLAGNIRHIRFNCPADLIKITEKTAALFVEPVQGEAGVVVPDEYTGSNLRKKNFLQLLRERCNDTGALLVFDEAQTGIGRTGRMFAFEHYGAVPDILCLAKAVGGGMPLAAFIAGRKIMKCLSDPPFGHITTFGGNPLSCAAGSAVLNTIMDKKLLAGIARKEKIIRRILVHPQIRRIRGVGLMLALVLKKPAALHFFIRKCREEGLITDYFLFSENAVRIYPPLTVTDSEIISGSKIIMKVLDKIEGNN